MLVTIDKQKLNDVTEKMCDEYCKWPMEAVSQEVLNQFCSDCPLNTILCKDDEPEDSDCPWQE